MSCYFKPTNKHTMLITPYIVGHNINNSPHQLLFLRTIEVNSFKMDMFFSNGWIYLLQLIPSSVWSDECNERRKITSNLWMAWIKSLLEIVLLKIGIANLNTSRITLKTY